MTLPPVGSAAIVLGLAGLHRLATPAARQRYLAAAMELGFRHFDVAPAYGNGLNEVELGLACAGRRDAVTIATKFGIAPPMYGEGSGWAFAAVRVADRLLPGYRTRSERRDYRPDTLRRSIEGSLRRLRTDRVEWLLVHEPPAGNVAGILDDVAGEAGRLRHEGKICGFGVAGEFFDPSSLGERRDIELVQAPLGALLRTSVRTRFRRRAYFVYRAFTMQSAEPSYAGFVESIRGSHPDMDMVIGSTSIDRLRQIAALLG